MNNPLVPGPDSDVLVDIAMGRGPRWHATPYVGDQPVPWVWNSGPFGSVEECEAECVRLTEINRGSSNWVYKRTRAGERQYTTSWSGMGLMIEWVRKQDHSLQLKFVIALETEATLYGDWWCWLGTDTFVLVAKALLASVEEKKNGT